MSPLATDTTALVDRYVAMWNEPDPDARRAAIRALRHQAHRGRLA